MLLQFLIPHYHNEYKDVRPLLTSIAMQQGINFDEIGAIICNDGDDILLNEDDLKKYPFNIEYKVLEHRGVSATRQSCFDIATADYVMFCDDDDMFISMLGVYDIFVKIKKDGADMLSSTFFEECKYNGDCLCSQFVNKVDDMTFVHGKVFRRQYIIDQNIRFVEKFKLHEDSYFVYLCSSCLNSDEYYDYIEEPFYLWKFNKNSITRNDNYHLKTYVNLIDVYEETINELLRRGKEYNAQAHCVEIIYDLYYLINTNMWQDPENKIYKKAAEERMALFYNKYKDLFESSDDAIKKEFIRGKREIMLQDCNTQFETITFRDWIEYIEKLGNY